MYISARSAVMGRAKNRTTVPAGGWAGQLSELWYVQNHVQSPMLLLDAHLDDDMKDTLTTFCVIVVLSFRFLTLRAQGPRAADARIPFCKTLLFGTPFLNALNWAPRSAQNPGCRGAAPAPRILSRSRSPIEGVQKWGPKSAK